MNGQQAQIIEKEAQNMPLEIGFKRLSDNAILPTKANLSDSGLDLYAAQDVIISPGETVVVPTDLAVQLPKGYEAQVRPRSGITSKTKLRVQLGTIDESYRGNIGIIIDNVAFQDDLGYAEVYGFIDGSFSDEINGEKYPPDLTAKNIEHNTNYVIRKGDKIAQLVVHPIPATFAIEITGELEDSDRGANGFGSSGV